MLTLKQFRKLTRGLNPETPIEFVDNDYSATSYTIAANNVTVETKTIVEYSDEKTGKMERENKQITYLIIS